jgi:hypothetical protein
VNEEKFSCWAIDFWEKNKELDSLHLLNKFMEEKYFPLDNKLKEVREYIKESNYHCKNQAEQEQYDKELLEILDKENK